MLKSFEDGYVLRGFADLFADYGCTTLNTRFFWDDQVSTPDFDGIFSLIPVGGVQATHSIEFTDHLHGREGLQLVLRSLF